MWWWSCADDINDNCIILLSDNTQTRKYRNDFINSTMLLWQRRSRATNPDVALRRSAGALSRIHISLER